ncbi:unnamed protein product [Agarophyton chilense]
MSANDRSDVGDEEQGNYSFLFELWSAPCFRESTMYGIGGGVAIGSMQMLRSKAIMESAETMVKTGCAISLLSWMICRRRYYQEREATYETMEKLKRRQAQAAAARANKHRPQRERSSKQGDSY